MTIKNVTLSFLRAEFFQGP